jgi:hypothetical protein
MGVGRAWADEGSATGGTPARERQHRVTLANRVLEAAGLSLRPWGGRYVLASRTRRSDLVNNLSACGPPRTGWAASGLTRSTNAYWTGLRQGHDQAAGSTAAAGRDHGHSGQRQDHAAQPSPVRPSAPDSAVLVNELGGIGLDHWLIEPIDAETAGSGRSA